MSIKVRIVFTHPITHLHGKRCVIAGLEVQYSRLTLGDLTNRIEETEAHLSRITGMVVKIETASE